MRAPITPSEASPGSRPSESDPQNWVHDCPASLRTPVAGNAGTGSDVTLQRLSQKFTRLFHSNDRPRTGTAESDTSRPRVRSDPPLKIWVVKPAEGSSERLRSRLLIRFS